MMLIANAILVCAAALWLDSRMSAHDASGQTSSSTK